jgi:hypothetical protein
MRINRSSDHPSYDASKQLTVSVMLSVTMSQSPWKKKNYWCLKQMLCSLQTGSLLLVAVILMCAKFENDTLANAVDIPAGTSCYIHRLMLAIY